MGRFFSLSVLLLGTGFPLWSQAVTLLSAWDAGQPNSRLILDLSEEYRISHPDFHLSFEFAGLNNLTTRVQLAEASGGLPTAFAYASGSALSELIDRGRVVDVEKALRDLGVSDALDPAANQLLRRLVQGKGVYALPLGLNFEGIWYNKKLFAKWGLQPPKTWADLVALGRRLQSHGIVPMAVGGKDRWPLTRWINLYAMRRLGVDAAERAVRGELRWLDPGFLEAADAAHSLVEEGFFGSSYLNWDNYQATSAFLEGRAAMMYSGSWISESVNDPSLNHLGADGIGFFNVPVVPGGVGTIEDYSMNCGTVLCLSSTAYTPAVGDWVRFLVTHLGQRALEQYGTYKGYRTGTNSINLPPISRLVAAEFARIRRVGLWFEAMMDPLTTQVALNNAQGLFLGALSSRDYFLKIEKSWRGRLRS